LFIIDNTHKL
jgi:hypothetical protein